MTAPDPSTFKVLGPKDWVPKSPLFADFGTDLLSGDDRKKLQGLFKKAKDGHFENADDVKWLCETLDRVATLRRMDDYMFPEYVCLINYIACNAFALKFGRRMDPYQETAVLGSGEIMDMTMSCQTSGAVFMVRPVVRILEAGPGDREKFLDAGMKMKVDGYAVIDEPFRRHVLSKPMEGRAPFSFHSIPKDGTLFGVSPMTPAMEADGNVNLGIFLQTGTNVRIEAVTPGRFTDPVNVRVSLLGALYTTKASGGAVDWAVRNIR